MIFFSEIAETRGRERIKRNLKDCHKTLKELAYFSFPVNIVNQFSSETLQKICLSCHEVEATIVLENVMKVYTFLRRIRYKKLTQLCVKWFQNRNRND